MERQIAPTLNGIRYDHVARYEFASSWLTKHKPGCNVLDCAAGVGYGAALLGESGFQVVAVDASIFATSYANSYWSHKNVTFVNLDAYDIDQFDDKFDAIVSFESLEHFEWPDIVIKKFSKLSDTLLFSVPNEDVIPFGPGFAFHYRHYRSGDLSELVNPYRVLEEYGQLDTISPVTPGFGGRTLLGVASLNGHEA